MFVQMRFFFVQSTNMRVPRLTLFAQINRRGMASDFRSESVEWSTCGKGICELSRGCRRGLPVRYNNNNKNFTTP